MLEFTDMRNIAYSKEYTNRADCTTGVITRAATLNPIFMGYPVAVFHYLYRQYAQSM